MTSQVELPQEPNTPPIVLVNKPFTSVIKFDASRGNELKIPVQIRDDDFTEELLPRWRITTMSHPPQLECPNTPIPSSGELIRADFQIRIDAARLERGACSQIEFVVSSKFAASCDRYPESFDVGGVTAEDVGRAVFLVWEVGNDVLTNPMRAQSLVISCPAVDRTPMPTMEN